MRMLHALVLLAVRCVCLYFAFEAAQSLAYLVGRVVTYLSSNIEGRMFPDVIETLPYLAINGIASGVLWVGSGRCADWLVPQAVRRCGACGHPLPTPSLSPSVCSECGRSQPG